MFLPATPSMASHNILSVIMAFPRAPVWISESYSSLHSNGAMATKSTGLTMYAVTLKHRAYLKGGMD